MLDSMPFSDPASVGHLQSCLPGGGNMDKEQQADKKFLEEQLQWCKEQDSILEEIEVKLHEMKKIAEWVLEHELTPAKTDELNSQLNELKEEVHFLEKQLQSAVH